jgi:hypothetical protein
MANTKTLTREERKAKKRVLRRGLKDFYTTFTAVDRKKFRKAVKGGLRGFKLGTNQED